MNRYSVCLVGVMTKKKRYKKSVLSLNNEDIEKEDSSTLVINPGNEYLIQEDDVCIYVSLLKEANYDFRNAKQYMSMTH